MSVESSCPRSVYFLHLNYKTQKTDSTKLNQWKYTVGLNTATFDTFIEHLTVYISVFLNI